jgi:hypothetical protein
MRQVAMSAAGLIANRRTGRLSYRIFLRLQLLEFPQLRRASR